MLPVASEDACSSSNGSSWPVRGKTASQLFDSSTRWHFISEFNMVLNPISRRQIHWDVTGECSLAQSQSYVCGWHHDCCYGIVESLSIDHHFLRSNRRLWHLKINGDVVIGPHFCILSEAFSGGHTITNAVNKAAFWRGFSTDTVCRQQMVLKSARLVVGRIIKDWFTFLWVTSVLLCHLQHRHIPGKQPRRWCTVHGSGI